ncbi:hypothetical protein STRTUCAR8_06790, partial [Streptomyces turgidiscabies Car8]
MGVGKCASGVKRVIVTASCPWSPTHPPVSVRWQGALETPSHAPGGRPRPSFPTHQPTRLLHPSSAGPPPQPVRRLRTRPLQGRQGGL